MGFQRRVGRITEVRRSREELCLEWRIYDFLDLSDGHMDYYESYRFCFSNVCWYLTVFPNWVSQGWVHVALLKDAPDLFPKPVIGAFGVKGSNGVEKRVECECAFMTGGYIFGEKQFCKRSELSEQKHRLMPVNTLTITLEIKVPGIDARDSSAQTENLEVEVLSCIKEPKPGASAQTDDLEVDVLSETKKSSAKQQGGEKALEDFGKLLGSGDWSDVTVQVGAAEFRAHRLVLFARCPALSVSLCHETKEKASSRIVVEDCKPDVFQEFLHYLYTGSVTSLMERTVFGLYQIADRYLVEDLKRQCLEHIEDTLSVETFCESMRLALTHGERGLLQRATDFAVRNIRRIVRSAAWQDFILECPIEANEIFIKSLGTPSDSEE